MLKPWTVWITRNWKILQEIPNLPPEQSIHFEKQQLEPDREQWTGFKLGKEYVKAVFIHPAYLTYMQSTLCEIPGWMSTSWNQDC